MIHGIDHGIEKRYGEDSLALDKGEVRLALTTQTDCYAGIIATDTLANRGVFNKEAEYHEVEMSVVEAEELVGLVHRIMRWQVLTVLAVPYYGLQSTDELGKDRIDVVESREQNHDVGTSNCQDQLLRKAMRALDSSYGPRKELLRANIEGQDMARAQVVEDTFQGGTIGSEEEKLGPEAIGLLFIIVVILIRSKGGSVEARAHS
ncbi:hypothetical protein HG531_010921 [Fusarium graminearum]|nr:hypothetical protein HG531_010921 [Fusarium graminearum]